MPDRRVRFRVQYQGNEYTLQDPTTGHEVLTVEGQDTTSELLRAYATGPRVTRVRNTRTGEEWPVCGWCRDCRWWSTAPTGLAGTPIPHEGRCEIARTFPSLVHTRGVADMLTAPNFGCVQHEPREEPPAHD